nr:hypothetical protein [Corynebacterium pyruviciproducens]
MVYKHAPYTAEAAGFDENDAQWLAEQGFDSLCLGVMWKAVEPAPGIYDDAYLDSLVRTTDLLHRHGIYVLLDAHQDMYNERFEGEFAPDWAGQRRWTAQPAEIRFSRQPCGQYRTHPGLRKLSCQCSWHGRGRAERSLCRHVGARGQPLCQSPGHYGL